MGSRALTCNVLAGLTGLALLAAAAPTGGGAEPGHPSDAAASTASAASAASAAVVATVVRAPGTAPCADPAGAAPGCGGTGRTATAPARARQAARPATALPAAALRRAGLRPAARVRATEATVADPAGPLELRLSAPGRLVDVTVADHRGLRLAGGLTPDGRGWRNAAPLRASVRYVVRSTVERPDGTVRRETLTFTTAPPEQGGRLTVTFGPGPGTYGVGQPVTAHLSHPIPVADRAGRAAVEGGLRVTSRPAPAADGAWHWVDEQTLHYRPRDFWPAHATVRVGAGLDGKPVNDRLHGGRSRPLTFTTGERVEAVTDVAGHTMTVLRGGRAVRTIPVTTGKPGYRTREGVKVVLAKEPLVRMRGDSIGIARGSGDFYDLKVRYATRVTWSGEYLHAAPWSTAAQGRANVSHGCTGMSTADAAWLFDTVRQGDVIRVVNGYGERMTPFDNGFGDWNLSWARWRSGSALGPEAPKASGRLRPLA